MPWLQEAQINTVWIQQRGNSLAWCGGATEQQETRAADAAGIWGYTAGPAHQGCGCSLSWHMPMFFSSLSNSHRGGSRPCGQVESWSLASGREEDLPPSTVEGHIFCAWSHSILYSTINIYISHMNIYLMCLTGHWCINCVNIPTEGKAVVEERK